MASTFAPVIVASLPLQLPPHWLRDALAQPVVRSLGWALVHSLWQIAAVSIVAAVVLRMLRGRSSNARYLVTCAALLAMVVAPAMTLAWLVTHQPARDVRPLHPSAVVINARPADVHPVDFADTRPWTQRTWSRVVAAIEPAIAPAAITWSGGVLVLSLAHAGGWARLRRLRRETHELPDRPWRRMLDRQRQRLGVNRAVLLARSALVEVPTLIGWLRPIILLPASAMTGLTPEQLEGILAHELAHVRRHDYLVNLIQCAVETLLFYHPCAWWISHRIRQERENCCDDLAAGSVGDRRDYAAALAAMESLRHVAAPALALAARGPRGASLLPRVRRLLGATSAGETIRVRGLRRSRSLMLGAFTCAVVVAPLLSLHAEDRTADRSATQAASSTATPPPRATTQPVVATGVRPDDLKIDRSDAIIGPADLVRVTIADLLASGTQTSYDVTVTEHGQVSLPYIGAIEIGGKTVADAEKAVAKAYKDGALIANPQLSVQVTEPRSRMFSVLGDVRTAGAYVIPRSDFRLLDALAVAGGTSGEPQKVTIVRVEPGGGGKQRTIEIPGAAVSTPDVSMNLVIQPKDTIVVKASGYVGAPAAAPSGRSARPTNAAPADPATAALLEKRLPEVRFDAVALPDVVDFLRDISSANIFVNWRSLEAAGIDRNTPVSIRLRDVPLSKLLDILTEDISGGGRAQGGVGWTSDRGVITIATADVLRGGEDPRSPVPPTTPSPAPAGAPPGFAPAPATGNASPRPDPPLPGAGPFPDGTDRPDVQTRATLDRVLPDLHFDGVPLGDVIDFLRDVTGANINVNWRALEAAGVGQKAPISLRLKNTKFAKVLDVLLDNAGGGKAKLAYRAEGGVISISTQNATTPAPPPAPAGSTAAPSTAAPSTRAPMPSSRPSSPDHATRAEAPPKHYVRVTLAPDESIKFQDRPTDWDELPSLLAQVPDRGETVLEVALVDGRVTVAARSDAVGRAAHYARQLGFRYASDIGVPAQSDALSPATQPVH